MPDKVKKDLATSKKAKTILRQLAEDLKANAELKAQESEQRKKEGERTRNDTKGTCNFIYASRDSLMDI